MKSLYVFLLILSLCGSSVFAVAVPETPAVLQRSVYSAAHTHGDAVWKDAAPLFIGDWNKYEMGSALLRVAWHPKIGLSIYARILDDEISPSKNEKALFKGDGLEVYLDVRPKADRQKSYSSGAGQFILAPPIDEHGNQPRIQFASGDLSNVVNVNSMQTTYTRFPWGYELTCVIPPWEIFNTELDMHLDFALDDQDS
ncbi:MAG: hypothetical protein HRU15_13955, partial [Planctomycetes bacterium]|nr:hypothetical protein [Planctomycetota bacterium]